MLKSYASHTGISFVSSVFSTEALDRIVLASGAVPRDYVVLAAGAIKQAQRREKAKTVGVQDVNKAAGALAQVKLTELEDDASSVRSTTGAVLKALDCVRGFCLDETKYTYFRIDFHDKEHQPGTYTLVQNLMDLRLIHLINTSVSDGHQAGKRSEVYMLDLSQFSADRLKKHLSALDFIAGNLVLKKTGTTTPAKSGNTPNKLLSILRQGPLFELSRLEAPKTRGANRPRPKSPR